MDHGEDVRPWFTRAVGDDERGVRYHELTRASDPSGSAALRHLAERGSGCDDGQEHDPASIRASLVLIVAANIVEIAERPVSPIDVHTSEKLGSAL